MRTFKLNLCSMGDPTSPRTWSGTPYNIYSALTKENKCGEAFDANVTSSLKTLLSALSVPFYGTTDPGRALPRRYACAFKVAKNTRTSHSACTLHTSTLSLPFFARPRNQRHYLFCDSTWHLWSQYSLRTKSFSNRQVAAFERLESRAYSQLNHLFPTSEYVKQDLLTHYNVPAEKITVVNTGLGAIKPFCGDKDYSSRRILFAAKGRFYEKGGELVIEAFKRALKTDPDLRLTIIGSEEAKQYDGCRNITALGFIPTRELQELFNTHALFLMPAFNEPWGLVYLEAMACKMPIVGLNRNSFPEISGYGKYGFGIDTPDPELLARILIHAFRTPKTLKEIGQRAHENCLAQYTWENTTRKIVRVAEEDYFSGHLHSNHEHLQSNRGGLRIR